MTNIKMLKDLSISNDKFDTSNGHGFDGEKGFRFNFKDNSFLIIGTILKRLQKPENYMVYINPEKAIVLRNKRLSANQIDTIFKLVS
jgi:hypothetical protein